MPAAAQPEYEFNIETTTGMSAPPIGMMMSPPSASAEITISQKTTCAWVAMNSMISSTRAAARPALMKWRCGSMIGRPDILPLSLAKAITEPVKVMAPMARPIDISTSEPESM